MNYAVSTLPEIGFPPDDEAELVIRHFRDLIQRIPLQDALLFEWYFLDHRCDVESLSQKLGLSPAIAWQKLATMYSNFLSLRDLRQPPHAAD